MKKLAWAIFGVIAGLAAGTLGTIAFSGLLGVQALGIVVAFALVASGSWFLHDAGGLGGWLGYAVGTVAGSAWLTYFPPSDDLFVVTFLPNVWVVGAAVALVAPVVVQALRAKA